PSRRRAPTADPAPKGTDPRSPRLGTDPDDDQPGTHTANHRAPTADTTPRRPAADGWGRSCLALPQSEEVTQQSRAPLAYFFNGLLALEIVRRHRCQFRTLGCPCPSPTNDSPPPRPRPRRRPRPRLRGCRRGGGQSCPTCGRCGATATTGS